jgi:hypothetical protein
MITRSNVETEKAVTLASDYYGVSVGEVKDGLRTGFGTGTNRYGHQPNA